MHFGRIMLHAPIPHPTVHCRPMRWTDLAVTVSSENSKTDLLSWHFWYVNRTIQSKPALHYLSQPQTGVASKPNFAGCTGDGPTLRGFSRRLQYVAMRSYVGLTGSPSNSYSSDSSADRSISASIHEELEYEFLTQKRHEDTMNIMWRRDTGTIKKVTDPKE